MPPNEQLAVSRAASAPATVTQSTASIDAPRVSGPSEPSSTQRPAAVAARTTSVGPSLQVIAQDGSAGHTFPIVQDQTDIGRSEGEITLPDDRFMCPRHARIIKEGNRVAVQDLSSVNGIYKRLRNPVKLEHGDNFIVGLAVLRFEVIAPGEQLIKGAVSHGTQVFGSPPTPRYARISEQTMEGISRSIFVLSREETILGREVGDIVFSSDPFMSRRHAAITRNSSDGSFLLVDLGSSNGTFIRIRGQADLMSGDHIRVGQHLFRFELDNGQGSERALERVPDAMPSQERAQAR